MGLLGKLASGGMFGVVGMMLSDKDKKKGGGSGKQINGGPRTPPPGKSMKQINGGPRTEESEEGEFGGGFRAKARALDAERKNRRGF